VGENPATADAAGINVSRFKYAATILGAGISGLGGVYYVLDYNYGGWSTAAAGDLESLGWLAVALVIFAIWRPLNLIWGSYLFGLCYWLYSYISVFGIKTNAAQSSLLEMIPYVVTIVVLIVSSVRKKRENQPPASLGLSYFREER
ncbi:MAG: ABC transporter permease, partial [Ruminococcus sp.]|nr:ABC transporter permease [Ruminococcus sp.]